VGRTTSAITGHCFEAARHLELYRGTEGITHGEADEGSALTIDVFHGSILSFSPDP
jgi:hypothetical protein